MLFVAPVCFVDSWEFAIACQLYRQQAITFRCQGQSNEPKARAKMIPAKNITITLITKNIAILSFLLISPFALYAAALRA
jgi:hypothetical protein